MALQVINVGAFPNDATGDPARTAFQKINANFGSISTGPITFGPPPTPPGGTPVTIIGASPGVLPTLQITTGSGATTAINVTGSDASTLNTLTDATAAVTRMVSGTTIADFLATPAGAILRTTNAAPLTIGTNSLGVILLSTAGNVAINAPSSGAALTLGGSEVINAGALQVTGTGTGGFAGPGVELFSNGTIGAVQAFNRTSSAFIPMAVSGNTVTLNYGAAATPGVVLGAAGNVTIAPPSSGAGLTVSAAGSNDAAIFFSQGSASAAFLNSTGGPVFAGITFGAASSGNLSGGIASQTITATTGSLILQTVNGGALVNTLAIAPSGNVTIPAPTNGVALTLTGFAGSVACAIGGGAGPIFAGHALQVAAPNTAGQSNGIRVIAGTNSTDAPLVLTNAAQSVNYWIFAGDGGLVSNAVAGGNKGAGTINCAGLFVNGVAVTVP